MARLARIVVPGLPHHVTRRGNRRETVFFSDEDYRAYLNMMTTAVDIVAVDGAESEVWAWCLMPNHVHLIIVPSHEDGLRQREIVGRPIGDDAFLASLEDRLGRTLRRKKNGPRKKAI
ncbi:MAG: hypothetical protein O3C34_17825 [Proteobacteria bacterium]|nr:hypothetical protein [Pseudomonadota bacterium]